MAARDPDFVDDLWQWVRHGSLTRRQRGAKMGGAQGKVPGGRRHRMSVLDEVQLKILDVLIEVGGEHHSPTFGQTLRELASMAHGEEVAVGSNEYHRTSLAVQRLEEIGFLTVERAYVNQAAKANVVLRIELT